ncbi:hypothetical protein ACFQY0_03920 [Haloferula chungangensis]|uniref:Uncharacterized protein n=1 Tax=Haloferula chungangensis TaxID=1048331 RepID=A0ABW2L4U5_9BACT
MKIFTLISLWLGAASILSAGAPTQPTLTRYSKLWINSVFTTKPDPVTIEAQNPLEDYALGGISKLEDGYYAILLNKKKPEDKVVIYPGQKNEFEVLDVKWPSGSWRDAVVTVRSGSTTGTVEFDDKLLTVKPTQVATPKGPSKSAPKPTVNGAKPTSSSSNRTPRPRVVVPKK